MNRTYYKGFSYLFRLAAFLLVFSSCDSMLNLEPINDRTREEYWKTKEDVETSLIGAYDQLQNTLDLFYSYGEVRGDLIKPNGGDQQTFNNQMITETTGLVKWNPIYSTINRFNMVYMFAPEAQLSDITYTTTELKYDMGEALTIKALCYFYLARSFKDLVYTSMPSESDEQEYKLAPIPYTQVLDSVISDLQRALTMVRPDWSMKNFSSPAEKTRYEKGRVTLPAVKAILADALITRGAPGDFTMAKNLCNDILNDTRYVYLPGERFMENFYPGNSPESVFEVQFIRGQFIDAGPLYGWFNSRYTWILHPTFNTLYYWQGEDYRQPRNDDLRGLGVSFQDIDKYGTIWKFMLADSKQNTSNDKKRISGSTDNINYIFYRLSDIYFMKAEAQANSDDLPGAVETLKIVRNRAIPTPARTNPLPEIEAETVAAFENLLLDEKAREVGAEGKRWFDLVRIARRQDNSDVLIDRIAAAQAFGPAQQVWKSRLFDRNSWFLPIHRDELNANINLVQNPYYQSK